LLTFLKPNQRFTEIIDQAVRFTSSKDQEGKICGLPVKKEEDGSVYVPVPVFVKVRKLERAEDGRLKNKMHINLPWSCESNAAFGELHGSRIPGKNYGNDTISFWYKTKIEDGDIDDESDEFIETVW